MTKVCHVALLLAAALFALTACQSGGQGGAGKGPATPELTKVDAIFINSAGTAGLAEVAFGQLAATQAKDPAVRQLAEQIVADFTEIDRQVAALAQTAGMASPTDMDGRHQMLYRQLEPLNGPAFDRAYVNGQLQDLTMAIQAFQAESDSGSKPGVRSLATQSLPTLQQHLRTAAGIAAL
jgi:putative membrane protein